MRLIGFNFTQIAAERKNTLQPGMNINTNLELTDVQEEKIDMLKDKTPLKVSFSQTVIYSSSKEAKKQEECAKITFAGSMLIAASSEDAKELLKSWKKKEVPSGIKIPLFNIILTKCSVKALQLQEELNLPLHPQLPRLTPQPTQNK
ncbi:hypothetical protein EXS73_00915 [Candidatus Pacearchaeota archaeon]|nr:hypothetical protein [Candidatus Pacearchaeota archaeon]